MFDDVLLFIFHKNHCIIVSGDFLDVFQVIDDIQITRSKFASQPRHWNGSSDSNRQKLSYTSPGVYMSKKKERIFLHNP